MAFYQSQDNRRGWKPWALTVLSILIKHLLVFGAWTLLVYRYGVRKATGLFLLAGGILALSFVPYLPDGVDGILHNVILYSSISVGIGLGAFPPAIAFSIFVVVMMSVPFAAQWLELDEREAMGFSAVALVAFIPGTSPQYWIIVSIFGLALLQRLGLGRWYLLFTVVTTVALLVVYAAFATYIPLTWLAIMDVVWLVCIGALILIYRSARSCIVSARVGAIAPRDDPRLVNNEEGTNSP